METSEPSRPLSQSSLESVDMSISFSPTGTTKEKLAEAWPTGCVYPVMEILTTEDAYVQSLEQLIKGYRDPLSSWLQNTEEGETFIRKVFLNLGQLCNVHRRLLQSLQDKATDPMEFGQVFVRAEEDFSSYTEYCTNFKTAAELLNHTIVANAELRHSLEVCQQKLHHSLPLNASLIKPVQRILKYPLLLQNVVKHYNTEHYAYPSLRAALVAMKRTAEHINSVKRQQENTLRTKEIQRGLSGGPRGNKLTTYGELIQECKCKVHVGKKGAERDRELIIFDKLLLLLKKKDSNRYNYKGHIEVGQLKLDEAKAEPTGFKVYSDGGVLRPSQSYHIRVRSERVKQEVVGNIRQVMQCHIEYLRKKHLEMKQHMRRQRHSYHPSDYTTTTGPSQSVPSQGSRKRKAISEIFPTRDDDSTAQLQKAYRIDLEHPEIRVDGWGDGEEDEEGEREEWVDDEGEEPEDQKVPDGCAVLPVIDEGSIFSQSTGDQLLKPTRYGDKRSPMSGSVSMESLVSLSDIKIGEEEEGGGLGHMGRRYMEECDSGEIGKEGSGEGGEEGDSHKKSPRQVSKLRRKPAIRVKTVSVSPNASPATAKRHLARSLIREKAQLARAASYAVSDKDVKSPSVTESSDLIGPEDGSTSHDISLDSSSSLVSIGLSTAMGVVGDLDSSSACVSVTTRSGQEKTEEGIIVASGEGVKGAESVAAGVNQVISLGDGDHDDDDDGIEIVDSSDSEDEEEEEEDEEMSGASIEDELGSSLEQPVTVSRQKSDSSSSHDEQSSDQLQYQLIAGGRAEQIMTGEERGEHMVGEREGSMMSDGVQLSVVSGSHSPVPPGMGMEDSGFGTGDSWRSTEPRDLEPQSPATSLAKEDEAPLTTDQLASTTALAEHYATLPRHKTTSTSSSSRAQGISKPPHTLIFPYDYSPGPPHSHKSSSPSSSISSISRSGTKKSSRGFSRLVEYTRKLSSPAYTEESAHPVTQSLPPAGLLPVGRILKEPPEIDFVDKVFVDSLGVVGEDEEEEEGVLSSPVAKKLALDSSQIEGSLLESMAVGSSAEIEVGEGVSEIYGAVSDVGTKEYSDQAVSLPREVNVTVGEVSSQDLNESSAATSFTLQETAVESETTETEVHTDGQTIALSLAQRDTREDDSVTPQPIPSEELPVYEGDAIPPVESREGEDMEEGEIALSLAQRDTREDDSVTPQPIPSEELPVYEGDAIPPVESREGEDMEEGEGGIVRDDIGTLEVEEPTLAEPSLDVEITEEDFEQHKENTEVVEVLPVTGSAAEQEAEKDEIQDKRLVVDEAEKDIETVEAAATETVIDEVEEAPMTSTTVEENGENLIENGKQHTDRKPSDHLAKEKGSESFIKPQNIEDVVKDSKLGERGSDKDVNSANREFNLNHRTIQTTGRESQSANQPSTAVSQAGVSLGLFGTLRRLRQWSVLSNRRIILLLGALGLVASVLFLGVNMYFDSEAQAERPTGAL